MLQGFQRSMWGILHHLLIRALKWRRKKDLRSPCGRRSFLQANFYVLQFQSKLFHRIKITKMRVPVVQQSRCHIGAVVFHMQVLLILLQRECYFLWRKLPHSCWWVTIKIGTTAAFLCSCVKGARKRSKRNRELSAEEPRRKFPIWILFVF